MTPMKLYVRSRFFATRKMNAPSPVEIGEGVSFVTRENAAASVPYLSTGRGTGVVGEHLAKVVVARCDRVAGRGIGEQEERPIFRGRSSAEGVLGPGYIRAAQLPRASRIVRIARGIEGIKVGACRRVDTSLAGIGVCRICDVPLARRV